MQRSLPFLLPVLLVMACGRSEPAVPVDLGLDYFPMTEGAWIEYTVDSVWRNDNTGHHDSVRYALREELAHPFNDLEGRPALQVQRQRQDSAGTWGLWNVWWQTADVRRAERSEDDQRRVKLVFPPRSDARWNTNSTNAGRAYELAYLEIDVPWSVNGMYFPSTVLVRTTYPNNIIVSHTYLERYAKGVGLVYRQVDSTDTQFPGTGLPKVRGTWFKQVVTAHGQ